MSELQAFPEFKDNRGSLVVWENNDLPFLPSRTFMISEVPKGQTRAKHAVNFKLLITAIAGSFEVQLNRKEKILLNDKRLGLLIKKDTYIELSNFTASAIALVFAEKPFSQTTYSHQ